MHKNKYKNAQNPNFTSSTWIMNNLYVLLIGQILKIPIFHLFHDLEKMGKFRLEQYSKLTMLIFFVNWEKTGSTT